MGLRSGLAAWFKAAPAVIPGGDVPYFSGGWGPGGGGWGWNLPSSRIDYALEAGEPSVNAIVAACVGWICRTFPEAPIRVMQYATQGTQDEVVPNHPLLKILNQPNPYYNGLLLWQGTLTSLNVDGNGYWLKMMNGEGIGELWWEPHTSIRPVWDRDGTEFITGYQLLRKGHWDTILPRERIVHFRMGLDPDNPRLGLSPLKAVLREIFTDNEAANFSAALLRNMGVPGVVVSPSGEVPIADPEGLKNAMVAKFSGDRRGEPLVMQGPTKVEVLSFSPDQMNLEKIRRIPEERITGVLGLPASVAGMGAGYDHSTYNNRREDKAAAYEGNLLPAQRALALQLNADVLPYFGNPDTEYVDFDTSEVEALADNQDDLVKRLTEAYQGGWLKRSEARLASNMNLDVNPDDEIYISDEIRKAARITETDPAGTLLTPEMLAALPDSIRQSILNAAPPPALPAPIPFPANGQKSMEVKADVLPRPSGNSQFSPGGIDRRNNLMQAPSTDKKVDNLRHLLHAKTQEQYARTVAAEAAKLGVQLSGDITDQAVIDALGKRADWASEKVGQTYQKQLDHAAQNGESASDVNAARDYKPAQIWDHELGIARNQALMDFHQRNNLTTQFYVDPGTAARPDGCEDLIGLGTVDRATAEGNPLPLHPNCPHGWQSVLDDSTPVIPAGASFSDGSIAADAIPASSVTADMLTQVDWWTAGLTIDAALADKKKQEQTTK